MSLLLQIIQSLVILSTAQLKKSDDHDQTCKMSLYLHHPNFSLKNFTPKKSVISANTKFVTKQLKQ